MGQKFFPFAQGKDTSKGPWTFDDAIDNTTDQVVLVHSQGEQSSTSRGPKNWAFFCWTFFFPKNKNFTG